MEGKKRKLTEEQVKALLGASCGRKQWYLMKRSEDYNRLALFLKINGVDKMELGQKAYTYEVDLKDETIAGAFIVTERPYEDGTRWYIAAMTVAPDHRGHKIGDIMFQKIKKLVKADGGDRVYAAAGQDDPAPDDMDGVSDAASFWEAEGMEPESEVSRDQNGNIVYSAEV